MAKEVDNIPALLTEGEFVMTDKAVENAGGPRVMYALMNALDPNSEKPEESGIAKNNLLSRTGKSYKQAIKKASAMSDAGYELPKSLLEPAREMRETKGLKGWGKKGSYKEALRRQQLLDMIEANRSGEREMNKGGSVENYSLMGLMMPTMNKRLGKPLMKFQTGGYVPATQEQQQMLIQPSTSYSTNIGDIYGQAGLATPGEEYLSTIEAYDPTRERRLQQQLGTQMPTLGGGVGGGFAGETGAQKTQAEKQRDMLTQQMMQGAQDWRRQYVSGIQQKAATDIAEGIYDFGTTEDLARQQQRQEEAEALDWDRG